MCFRLPGYFKIYRAILTFHNSQIIAILDRYRLYYQIQIKVRLNIASHKIYFLICAIMMCCKYLWRLKPLYYCISLKATRNWRYIDRHSALFRIYYSEELLRYKPKCSEWACSDYLRNTSRLFTAKKLIKVEGIPDARIQHNRNIPDKKHRRLQESSVHDSVFNTRNAFILLFINETVCLKHQTNEFHIQPAFTT